jgi:hypothetical protein
MAATLQSACKRPRLDEPACPSSSTPPSAPPNTAAKWHAARNTLAWSQFGGKKSKKWFVVVVGGYPENPQPEGASTVRIRWLEDHRSISDLKPSELFEWTGLADRRLANHSALALHVARRIDAGEEDVDALLWSTALKQNPDAVMPEAVAEQQPSQHRSQLPSGPSEPQPVVPRGELQFVPRCDKRHRLQRRRGADEELLCDGTCSCAIPARDS